MDVHLKRAYERASASDGYRVLIDRLWPRGVIASRMRVSTSGPASWRRAASYGAGSGTSRPGSRSSGVAISAELAAHEEKLRELRRRAREGTLTLVYGARDTEHNDAVVLAEILRRGRRRRDRRRAVWRASSSRARGTISPSPARDELKIRVLDALGCALGALERGARPRDPRAGGGASAAARSAR